MALRKKTGKGISKGGGDVLTINNRGRYNMIEAGRGTHVDVSRATSLAELDIRRKKWKAY